LIVTLISTEVYMNTPPKNYDALVSGLPTKSEKIRALAQAGVATADIARYLGIRYQHARNVIKDAELSNGSPAGGMSEAPAPGIMTQTSSPSEFSWIRIDESGGMHIPERLLALAGIKVGDDVYLGRTEDGLEFFSRRAALARAHRITAKFKRPGVSEVDEFIEDKRREAREEDNAWARDGHL
jgi:bifunctional DNA-binding transcriptional regulator/antitoxin component of YhaV-PrlF toxin-antitoxin module